MPYIALMLQRLAHRVACGCFPYPRRVIGARGHHPLPVRAKVRTVDSAIMPKRLAHRFTGRRPPTPAPYYPNLPLLPVFRPD